MAVPFVGAARAIAKGVQVWTAVKPIRRVKRALNKRRAKKGKSLLVINEEKEIAMGKELAGSVVRHFVPVASAYLAGQGVELGAGADPVVMVVVAAVVYAAMQAWSFVRKVKNKPRDV